MQLCWEACFGRKAAWGVALEWGLTTEVSTSPH
jgi:hypothetical protein